MNKTIKRVRPYPHFKFPDEITIEVEKLGDSARHWHNLKEGSYSIRTSNYGWFPTDVLMGVDNKGRYCDSHNIGAQIGTNLGTASIAVVDIDSAIQLLNNAGYFNISQKP